MADQRHTPGDWKVEHVTVGGTTYQGPERIELWITVGEHIIATIDPATGECPPEYEANAKLIISAPTLQAKIEELEKELLTLITFSADLQQRLEAEKAEVKALLERATILLEEWQQAHRTTIDDVTTNPKIGAE